MNIADYLKFLQSKIYTTLQVKFLQYKIYTTLQVTVNETL